jgi:hypothetical protein
MTCPNELRLLVKLSLSTLYGWFRVQNFRTSAKNREVMLNITCVFEVYLYLKCISIPIRSMYAIYGDIYHQYTPNVSIYTINSIHGSYGIDSLAEAFA